MKLKLLIAFLLLVNFSFSQAYIWQWAQSGSGSNSETGNAVATDGTNAFVTGYFFSSTITFGTYTLTNSGNYDTYLVKYNSLGVVQWAKSANGAFDDIANGITTDPSGNVYVTGYFTSPTLIFGTYTLTNTGGTDIFIVKYDTNGNVVWAKSEGASSSEESNGITSDPSGNIFVTGWFQSASLTIGTNTLTNTGGGDVFIAKYDAAGNPQWAMGLDGSGSDIGYGISADPSGNVCVSGSFKSSVLTAGTLTVSNVNPGQADFFVAKYNGSGLPIWLNSAGGALEEIAYSITCDPFNNVIVCGSYKSSTLTLGTNTFTNSSVGSCEIFVVKYNSAGNVAWSSSVGGTSDDIPTGIDSDALGFITVTGHMHSNSMVCGSQTLFNTGTSVGDVFVFKHDVGGSIIWSENEGGTLDDGGSSVACGSGFTTFVTGFFVGPSINFGGNVLNSAGNSDMFVAKLSSNIGITEMQAESGLTIFPNPGTGIFYILNKNGTILNLELYSVTGELIFETFYGIYKIDISDKPKGIYFVRVTSTDGIIVKKIILN